MSRLFQTIERFSEAIGQSNAQLFVTGGHGGLVTYDGQGGVMRKQGGPMDRLFLLMNDGQLLGDAGLDIEYGHIEFCTGKLDGTVQIIRHDLEDTCIQYNFEGNDNNNGVEVKGGISLLGIPRDSVLVSGSVSPSVMMCDIGDKSGKDSSLPFVAWHQHVLVNDKILEWFNLDQASVIAAETGWCKIAPREVGNLESHSAFGAVFQTQQHLGHLRVFLKVTVP